MMKEQTMTPLRRRMIEDMKLAGLAAKTQEVYQQAVSALVKHYRKSPEQLTEEEVRRYLLEVRERTPGQFKTSLGTGTIRSLLPCRRRASVPRVLSMAVTAEWRPR